MKKNTIIVITALIIIAIGIGLYRSNSDQKIKIGLVGPFTGNSAFFGEYMQRGLDFAMNELTPEQKSNIEIIKEDDMCAGKNAIGAVQKLISVDHVNYIIGPLCNESTIATEKLFEDNKVLSLTVGLPSNQIANMGPYHFSFSPEIEYMMKAIATEMTSKNLKKVAILHISGTFQDENYRHFVTYYTAGGGQIVDDETLTAGSNDFRTAILKAKQAKPDSLMIIAYTADLNNILKQLGEQNMLGLPKYSIHAAETGVLLKEKGLAEGLVYPYPGDKTQNASAKAYADMYEAKYNTSPDPSSTNVYDSFNILLGAIEKCGHDNKDCVQQTLANLKDYQGANGNLSVDSRGVGTYKEVMIKTVKDGKFEKLAE